MKILMQYTCGVSVSFFSRSCVCVCSNATSSPHSIHVDTCTTLRANAIVVCVVNTCTYARVWVCVCADPTAHWLLVLGFFFSLGGLKKALLFICF